MEGIDQVNLLPHLLVIAFSFLIFSFISQIAYHYGYYQLPKKTDFYYPVTFLKLIGVFFLFILSNALVVLALKAYLSVKKQVPFFQDVPLETKFNPFMLGWIDLFFIIFSLLILILYSSLLGRETCKALAGSHFFDGAKRMGKDLAMGALTILIAYPLVTGVNELFAMVLDYLQVPPTEQVPVEKIRNIIQNRPLFFFTSISVLLLVPIAEEILFRGYLQAWLSKNLGRITGIVLASLIFAAFHYAGKQGIRNIQIVGTLFVFSLFLGFIKERQQSLWASIGTHSIFNAIALGALFIESLVK